MPAADKTTPQTIRKKLRRKKKPAPSRPPTRTQIRSSKAQERQYVSQGKAVEKAGTQQRKERQARIQQAGYKSQAQAVEREARKRTGRGAIVRQAKKELEGRGALAKGLGRAANYAEKVAVLQSTGGGPSGGVRLGVKAGGGRISPGAATALAPRPVRVKGTFAGKLLKDALNAPAQALPAVYVPAAGLVEAAKGHPQRIKQFAKDVDKTDPIYNTGAAVVAAAHGDIGEAKKRIKQAGKSVSEHPGFAAIEALGVKGTVGRGAGAVARSGAAGKAAKGAASTERAARTVPGTRIREERAYSRDVLTKAGQVAVEKSRRRSAAKLRRKADRAPKGSDKELTLRRQAAARDPDRVPEHEIARQMDEQLAVNEDVRRAHLAKTASEARRIVRKAETGGAANSVVAQRIARADKPDLQAYVDELKGEFGTLSNAGKRANRSLRRELQKVIDDPKSDLGSVETVAREYEKLVRPLEKKLVKRGLLGSKQEAKAKLIPYAVRHMGAKHDPEKGIVSRTGVPLSDAAIRGHMKRAGIKEPAYITQAPNRRGARNFYVSSFTAPKIKAKVRTGEATRTGTFDASPETLVEGAARTQSLVDATDGFRKTIKQFAVRGQDKKVVPYKTYDHADRARRELDATDPESTPMRPVRLNPFGGKGEQLDKLLEHVDSMEEPQAKALVQSMHDALTATSGKGPWALIPEAAARRMEDQLKTLGGGGGIKTLQLANQTFRKTVLATSTTWLAGNVIEGLGRAALAKAGPGSYLRGRAALRELGRIDPKKAEEAAFRIVGGGHFASVDRLHVRRGAEQFEATRLAPIATALGKFWRAPGPKQAAQLWNHWTDFVFHAVNGKLESGIQTAMLGRALKTSGLKAIDDAAKGLRETPAQVRFGREVDRMFGRYGKLSPYERRLVTTYTPFIAWAGNAVYFVTRTLPRDHPVVTAVIASAEQATDEWRKTHGLDLFVKGALPGFLQGSVPSGGGAHQRISRYTPFGAFGDPTGTAAGQVLPLMSGVLAAFKGQDWKGQELRVKGDDGKTRPADPIERTVFAAKAFVEATVPVYGQAQNVLQQGPRALDPFKDVKPKKLKAKKLRVYKSRSRSSGGSSDSGGSFFGGSGSSGSSGGGFFGP